MPDFSTGLRCKVCGKLYEAKAINFCTDDFGPLEVDYDYAAVAKNISREKIEKRPRNMWRYRELLPLQGEPTVGLVIPVARLALDVDGEALKP